MNEFANILASILKDVTVCVDDSALAFSGGLDSGILAYLLRDCNIPLYTVGIENSKDVENAKKSAKILNMSLEIIEIDEYDILEGLLFLKRIDPSIKAVEASFELPLYFVCSYTSEKNIYTGQGSDELFGGYYKYLKDTSLMKEDLNRLLSKTKPREIKIATLLGKELFTPYLNTRIIEFSKTIPTDLKIKNSVRKWILREAGKQLGVPEEILNIEKKAAQYGSGIWKMMKKMAKDRDLDVESFVASL